MRCKNCKHFISSFEDDNLAVDKFGGKCTNEKLHVGYNGRFVDYGVKKDDGDVNPDGCIIEDDEGWGIMVGMDFGCIHFEDVNK